MRWSHVGLNCTDPRATADFYSRWFGFTRARVVPVDSGEIIFLRSGNAYLELFPADRPDAAPSDSPASPGDRDGPASPGVIRHIAFQTESVDSFLRDLGDSAEVTLGPLAFDEVIPGWRTVWIRDPDGIVVEVSEGYRDQANRLTDSH